MNAKTDEQRPLTEQGIEESIHMAWLAPQLTGSSEPGDPQQLPACQTDLAGHPP